MFTFHTRFFSLSAVLSESFSLPRAEQEFSHELFEVAVLHARAADLKLFCYRWPCVKGRLLWAWNRGHCMLYSQMQIKVATGHCSLEHVVT